MNEHFFNSKGPIPIIGFVATFKFACDTNYVHEGTAMWALPHFIDETLTYAPNSRMYAEHSLALLTASVRDKEPRFRKLLVSYPEVVNYFLKTFATDRTVAEYDASILEDIQPSSLTLQ